MARQRPAPHPQTSATRVSVRLLGVAGLACVGLGAAAWILLGRSHESAGRGRPNVNVLLVTIDTLRTDGLSCYGNPEASTPVLDTLAARGTRFETVIVTAPLTAPSHASILTGLNPVRHGVRDNGGFVLPETLPVLAEVFGRAGYHTAAFVSGYPLRRDFGFSRGFDVYDDHLPRGDDARRAPYVERSAGRTTDKVLRWLGDSSEPFFSWVHYYDPHAPYEPPAPYAERFASRPYYGEVAYVDAQIGRLLERLEEGGLGPRTIVLVIADHAESLGEHGEETHGIFVHDSTLAVPWIMAGPGIPADRVVSTIARGIDLAPTLLDYAGLPEIEAIDGRSLRLAVEKGTLRDAPAYAESLSANLHFGWAPLHVWRTRKWKLVEAPRPELYDLDLGLEERRDVAAEHPAVIEELRAQLQAVLDVPTPEAEQEMDAETAARLAALGYLVDEAPRTPTEGPLKDPKDYVSRIGLLERGMSRARIDPPGAIADLTEVLRQDPGVKTARRVRAVAYARAHDAEAAMADVRELEKVGSLTAGDLVILGESLRLVGRTQESLEALEQAVLLQPGAPQPWFSRASVLLEEGRSAEAAAAFEQVLELVPDHIEALRGLGDVALLQEDVAAAARHYGRILEVDPQDTGAITKLGVVRVRQGRSSEAISLFRRAVGREPGNAEALLYLAGALAAGGRTAEALPFFERAAAAGPGNPMALNGLALARLQVGDRAGAARALRESLALDPAQPGTAQMLADLQR